MTTSLVLGNLREVSIFAKRFSQELNAAGIFQENANSLSALEMSQPNSRAEGAIPTVIKIEGGQDLLQALQDGEKKKRLAEMERRVMEAFEKVKSRMCKQAVKETQAYLDQRDWVKDCKNPSNHPFYYRIKGGSCIDSPGSFYYPNFLVMQAIWPENSTVERIAISFAKYWKCADMVEGPEHYPMLNDTAQEMKLFSGLLDMSWKEWRQRDHWFARYCEQRIEEEEDASTDKPEESKDTNTTTQTNANDNLDEMEAEAENRVKKITEKLQKAKEDLRKVQKRKRDHYKSEAEFWMKSSEVFKQKAARDTRKADNEKSQAEWNVMMAKMYAEKLGRSPPTAAATNSSGERRPGEGHLDKRQRTKSEGSKPLLAKNRLKW